MIKCKLCQKEVENLRGMAIHLKSHSVDVLDYYVRHESFNIPKCTCDKNCIQIQNLKFKKTCGNKNCQNFFRTNHSEDTRNKISIARKNYLKNNKNNIAWTKKVNKPEQLFKNLISKIPDVKFIQYYIPKESDRFFEIDFAIPDLKIGFEVNGNQHYKKDGNLTEYHQKRKEYLESLGWIIIDIHYSVCFRENLLKQIVKESINGNVQFIQTICNEVANYHEERKKEKVKKKQEYEKQTKTNKALKKKKEEQEKKELIMLIDKLGIGNGTITKMAKELNISHTTIRRRLEKHKLIESFNNYRKILTEERKNYYLKVKLNKKYHREKEEKRAELIKQCIDKYGKRSGLMKYMQTEIKLFGSTIRDIADKYNIDLDY